MRSYLTGFIFLISVQAFALSDSDLYLQNFLITFKNNPSKAMNLIPPKYNSNGRQIKIHREIPIETKDQSRIAHCHGALPGESCQTPRLYPFSEISGSNDLRNFFFDEKIITQAEESSAVISTKLPVQPWSSDYWPTYRGGIAARYKDTKYPYSQDFSDYLKYFNENESIDLTDQKKLDILSPSEKYDLLMGHINRPLSNAIIKDAQDIYETSGQKIEAWFGICHGWAPASFMLSAPKKTVTVESLIPNVKLNFFPDDIKALASHLWANAQTGARVMGGRCDEKNPKHDSNGRTISENCYDINPGSWHLAIFNQLAVQQKSFVIDATYDYEVWNQPVLGYKLSFFNPKNHKVSNQMSQSLIQISEFQKDPFKKYRSPNAAFIVGISMQLTYISENVPSGDTTSSETAASQTTVQYVYDLEIDQQGHIIGGEWYQNAHPDFIWSPLDGDHALSHTEHNLIGTWSDSKAPPAEWADAAIKATDYNQVLSAVIENLVQMSQ